MDYEIASGLKALPAIAPAPLFQAGGTPSGLSVERPNSRRLAPVQFAAVRHDLFLSDKKEILAAGQ